MKIAFTHTPEDAAAGESAAKEARGLGHQLVTVEVSGPLARTVAKLERAAPDLVVNALSDPFFLALFDRLGLTHVRHQPGSSLEAAVKRSPVRPKPQASGLTVGLTFNLKRVQSTSDGQVDSDAEYDSPKVIKAIREAIESHGHRVVELEATADLPVVISATPLDVVFNLAEGLKGRNREAQVPAILEMLDIPYTGSDAATMALALDKALAKRLVQQAGFPTAPFVVMNTGREPLPDGFTFPAMVKPVAEGSSKGVMKSSVVEDEPELRALVAGIIGKYRQGALVEAFLPGREFTVALLGEHDPHVLPPMEIVFTNPETKRPVYAFDHKLDWTSEVRYDRPAQVDAATLQEIERVAKGAFFALGCRDLARVDLRMDQNGRLNFIEVNPLPGLSPGWSDMCLVAESAGIDYRTLIGQILAPAIRRYGERKGTGVWS